MPQFIEFGISVIPNCFRISVSPSLESSIFVMATMSFPCNGILLIQSNLPRIFPMSTLSQASFPIPISNYFKIELGMAQLYILN